MKKIIMMAFCLVSIQLQAEVGCMEASWHLSKPFDNKELHYVQCNCPCHRWYHVLTQRGECIQCGHLRVPRPDKTVQTTKEMRAKLAANATHKKKMKSINQKVFGDIRLQGTV